MPYKDLTPPAGDKITRAEKLTVPDHPVIPFIRGDGTGPDIWAASVRVMDAAVEKAYGGKKKISWFEVFAGQAAKDKFDDWLPDDTVTAFREYLVGIKGPLTTPVGGGISSLNVALRQMLDLFVCLRPVQYFQGVPSPVKHPEKVDMVIFRENTEDIYAGIEWAAGTPEAKKILDFLETEFPKAFAKIRFGTAAKAKEFWDRVGAKDFPSDVRVGVGIKPVSYSGTRALDSQRDQLRDPEQAQERHARAQGQYHEIHRGRVSRLGLRSREVVSSARRNSTADRGARFRQASRARGS